MSLPRDCRRLILLGPEDDVLPDGVGPRVHGLRRFGCPGIGVYAHPAEVMAEARLHECASGGVQRLARRPQHFVNNTGHGRDTGCRDCSPVQAGSPVFATRGALAAAVAVPAAAALALQDAAYNGSRAVHFGDIDCGLPIHGENLLVKAGKPRLQACHATTQPGGCNRIAER